MGNQFSSTSIRVNNDALIRLQNSFSAEQRELWSECFIAPPPRALSRSSIDSSSSSNTHRLFDIREELRTEISTRKRPIDDSIRSPTPAKRSAPSEEGAKLRTRLIAAKRDRDYLTKRRERGFAEARDSVDKDVKSPNGYSIIKCLLCDGNHFTNSCYVYESYAQRTERCIQMDLCPTCMFRKHDGVCRLSHDCRTCRKGSHAAAMCSWHVELDNEIRELEKELSRLEDGERWRDVERR
ncbi:hypothetical protein QR680_012303 [Steinernema hermaphroditum]|uniref:Uncharacterized protein n=1 Tax=Steinernema hermaphroditum TaxID=289476 RepID=A0AA39I4B9_9BILA|nr:hypothetical protein QR680_012303 [Steinernema hermaphroditum]